MIASIYSVNHCYQNNCHKLSSLSINRIYKTEICHWKSVDINRNKRINNIPDCVFMIHFWAKVNLTRYDAKICRRDNTHDYFGQKYINV